MGFNAGANDCKDCTAYGLNTNTYNCAKNFKCIDGSLGVASSSSLIIFQSIANPANPYAQKTGEPNLITGVVDKITLEAFAKNFTTSKLNADIVGFPNIQREDMLKNWKPVKYETIANETLSKELTVYFPCMKKDGIDKAVISPSVAVAWAMLVQGAIDTKKLDINYLRASGPISGFRSYAMQVKAYFDDPANASLPYFDKTENIASEKKLYLKNKNGYDFENKTKQGGPLSGRGKSNHGKCKAIDFVCGSKGHHHLATDPDGTKELIWLGDNAGRYGFSGLVFAFNNSKDLIKAWDKRSGFNHFETWHWEYLVDANEYLHNGIKYRRTDCFIKEKRDELLK